MKNITNDLYVKIFDINMLIWKIGREYEAYTSEIDDTLKLILVDQIKDNCQTLIKRINQYFKEIPSLNAYENICRNKIISKEWTAQQAVNEIKQYIEHYKFVSGAHKDAFGILEQVESHEKSKKEK